MRFPVDPLPPVGVTDDLYEIQEKAALTPLRPVGVRTVPPVMPRPRQRHVPEPPQAAAEQPAPVAERREAGDRRKIDRRISNQPVTVDTRSGIDRRHGKRRDDDPTTRIDIKA
jgi:hypothetical protein